MEIPSLDSLLVLYAAQSANTPGELAQIAASLGISFPADYRALTLRYNLAAVEINFSRFFPPVVQPMGLSAALTALSTSGEYTFAEAYRTWGVAPVGQDAWEQEIVLVIRQPTDPRGGQPQERTHLLAPTRPYGSVWAI